MDVDGSFGMRFTRSCSKTKALDFSVIFRLRLKRFHQSCAGWLTINPLLNLVLRKSHQNVEALDAVNLALLLTTLRPSNNVETMNLSLIDPFILAQDYPDALTGKVSECSSILPLKD